MLHATASGATARTRFSQGCPAACRAARKRRAVARRGRRLIAALAFLAQLGGAAAANAQLVEFSIPPQYIGPVDLQGTALEGLAQVGFSNLTGFGGSAEFEYRVGQSATQPGAVAPGFAILDRTLLARSSFGVAEGRYQIQLPVRDLRTSMRRGGRYGRELLNHYDTLDLQRARASRIRGGLFLAMRDIGALDAQGRVDFGRFARALRVVTFDEANARWLPAVDFLRARRQSRFLFGARADFALGHHGVDTQQGLVWTVSDYPGAFSLGFPVPEPAAALGLAAGAALLVAIRRWHTA